MVIRNDEILKKVLACVREDIFKDVRFYLTGSASDVISQILLKGGAKQEVHITDFLTHLIVGNDPDEHEVGEVRDIYQKPVVTLKWAVLSAKCGSILPTKAFDYDDKQLFSGVKASLSKVPSQDARTLWGLITFYGGQCILHFDNTCTHLIVGEPKGVKLQRAYEKKVLIVTPDWVTESVEEGEKLDEFFYHPRLLNLSPSATPLPSSSYSKECHELKKLQAEKEAEEIASNIAVMQIQTAQFGSTAVTPQAQTALDSKGIFDSLVFSDEEDEGSNPEQKSLLDQLKNAQTWKSSSSSSSSPVQINTRPQKIVEKGDLFSVDSSDFPKPMFDTVTDSFSSQPFGIDSSLLSSLLDDNSSSSKELPPVSSQSCDTVASAVAAPSTAVDSPVADSEAVTTAATASRQLAISFNDSYVAYAEKQLSSPVSAAVQADTAARSTASAVTTDPPVVPPVQAPVIAPNSPLVSTANFAITTASDFVPPKAASPTYASISIPENVTSTSEVQLVNAEHIQSYQPPQLPAETVAPAVTISGTPVIPTPQMIKQPELEGFPADGEKLTMPMLEPTMKQVIDNSPQAGYSNKFPVSVVRSAAPVHQQPPPQAEVSGSVLQLPIGITPGQLRMMGNAERQRLLEQLHQKQVIDQQQRAHQLAAGSMQIRTSAPYSQIRTPQNELVQQQQPVQGWAGGIPQQRLRTSVPQYAQSQVKSQPGPTMVQTQTWQGQPAASPQVAVNAPVGGQSAGFQLPPQLGSEGHPPQSPLTPQSPLPSPSYVRTPQSPQVTQQVMLGQQQSSQLVRHVQVPVVGASQQQQQQQMRQAVPQQQYTVSQGATRIVSQPGGWQQQQPVQVANPSNQPQPTPQLQLQVQHLRAQFPFLSQQEAQQFLHSIPSHLREIQVRDAQGRAEYLGKLEPRERQVVTAVAEFYSRRHQQQQQLLQRQQQQQQQQIKVSNPQQSSGTFQSQFTTIPQNRVVTGRQLPPGYTSQVTPVVSPGQASPRLVQVNQIVPQQLTPQASPLASPHNQSPVQRDGTVAHAVLQGSNVPQNLASQSSLVNSKTKTALANLLTNRLSSTVQPGSLGQGTPVQIDVPGHVQKAGITPETVQGPSGEHLLIYQRRTLANVTNNVSNNVRPSVNAGHAAGSMVTGYPRAASVTHGTGPFPVIGSNPPHYPRLHLYGHDINILPRDICMVGCVFYIADYQRDLYAKTIECIKREIQQHGGEVVSIYDTAKVTHVLCKHQKSPVFKQAVRENKRCITIYWLNDILIRGKMAPPWQAYHLPVPFGDDQKPMRDLIVSITGFENEERATIKLMLNQAGAKCTVYFSNQNHLLICKRFEGPKVMKAKEWKKPTLNAVWLSEMLLGQNVPPLSFYGSRYQHFIDDPLRIDPSLSSYLFNAWKHPISVSKESVEKANAIREKALRKRKPDNDGNQENKRTKPKQIKPDEEEATRVLEVKEEPKAAIEPSRETEPPRIMMSNMRHKEEFEKKALELGGSLARSNAEMTHLVVGSQDGTAPRTVKVMCAISCAKYVLSPDWISHSYTLGKYANESNYSLKIDVFETLFDFDLTEILQKPNRNRLLNGLVFYLTPSVTPGKKWFKEIIECAGGTVDLKRKSISEIKERNQNGDLEYLCITCNKDSHLVSELLKEKLPVFHAEFVLNGIMTQRLNWTEYIYRDEINTQ